VTLPIIKGAEIDYPIQLIAEDSARLTRYLNHVTKDPSKILIVEFLYDSSHGKWKLKTIRSDKNRANHKKVVENTLFVIRENLTMRDLKHAFPPKNLVS
jgi:hypothetical protein